MAGREDFKTLVADVSMGQVGAMFTLDVSRLARSNLNWHRLLELCALTTTLVIDEDGCCDPDELDFRDVREVAVLEVVVALLAGDGGDLKLQFLGVFHIQRPPD
jgi:DNA invertase Pin-like site-specific DNA recombinase